MEKTLITAELADSVVIEKSKREAIEFAEWMVKKQIYNDSLVSRVNWKSRNTPQYIDGISTSQLYELFKKQQ